MQRRAGQKEPVKTGKDLVYRALDFYQKKLATSIFFHIGMASTILLSNINGGQNIVLSAGIMIMTVTRCPLAAILIYAKNCEFNSMERTETRERQQEKERRFARENKNFKKGLTEHPNVTIQRF